MTPFFRRLNLGLLSIQMVCICGGMKRRFLSTQSVDQRLAQRSPHSAAALPPEDVPSPPPSSQPSCRHPTRPSSLTTGITTSCFGPSHRNARLFSRQLNTNCEGCLSFATAPQCRAIQTSLRIEHDPRTWAQGSGRGRRPPREGRWSDSVRDWPVASSDEPSSSSAPVRPSASLSHSKRCACRIQRPTHSPSQPDHPTLFLAPIGHTLYQTLSPAPSAALAMMWPLPWRCSSW
jgi:hypothetical protein